MTPSPGEAALASMILSWLETHWLHHYPPGLNDCAVQYYFWLDKHGFSPYLGLEHEEAIKRLRCPAPSTKY